MGSPSRTPLPLRCKRGPHELAETLQHPLHAAPGAVAGDQGGHGERASAERSKKQSLAAELSRLKEDHAALDKSHRQLVSDHAKLEKAHVASKTRLESIEKERRCTSSANEKAVLEKRLRAAEDEAAKLKALYEKEKSRSLSAARKPAPKKA
eukprot:Sspe_Gene.2565::Locus_864_Transcript_1_1_Confidence_1.000_Length_2665::g.2565::m.2565